MLTKVIILLHTVKHYLTQGGQMENSKYKAFIASSEAGSFTKASRKLNYTPSGISQLVNALEEELGFKLFIRNKKGVVLTSNGIKVLPIIRSILKQEEYLNQLSSEINGLSTGNLTIAAYSSVSSHWLPSVIKTFKASYPNIELHLMEGIRQEVDQWLNDNRADIGFLSYQDIMQYEWIPVSKDPMLAILPLTHPLANADSYPIKNCQNEEFIMPGLGMDDDVIKLLKDNNLSPSIAYSTLENFAALALIEQGLGMSIMNELITKRWECDVIKLPLDPPQHITLGIAVHSLKNISPAAKKFIDITVNLLKNNIT